MTESPVFRAERGLCTSRKPSLQSPPSSAPSFCTDHPPGTANGNMELQQVPVADYRLTQSLGAMKVDGDGDGDASAKEHQDRSCYSFCMCPGGQVVPTSVDPKEVRRCHPRCRRVDELENDSYTCPWLAQS